MKFYDFTKGGTDIIDQRMGNYSVNTKSRRWTMSAFSYILDTMRVNAQTMYAINHKEDVRPANSFGFGWELALQLVKPYILLRKNTIKIIPSNILRKMNVFLNEPVQEEFRPNENKNNFPKQSDGRNWCHFCMEQIKGPGSTKKDAKYPKQKLSAIIVLFLFAKITQLHCVINVYLLLQKQW